MKYKMRDLTILIPVRIESMTRLENLLGVIQYFNENFDTNIIVLEAARFNNKVLSAVLPKSIIYIFVKDTDPVFYRTYYINKMALKATTDYIAVWDADVICPTAQVADAMEALRSKDYDIAYPYDGHFLDTSKLIREMYLERHDLGLLEDFSDMMVAPYGIDMRGGAFLANRRKYREAGMENLNFYGWGPEDWERFERWKNLDYKIKSISGNLYHLSHPRDMNGSHNSLQQKIHCYYEKDITCASSAEEIKKRIDSQLYE